MSVSDDPAAQAAYARWWRGKRQAESIAEIDMTDAERMRSFRVMEKFACPFCGAKAERPCTQPSPFRGEPPVLTRPHPSRMALLDLPEDLSGA